MTTSEVINKLETEFSGHFLNGGSPLRAEAFADFKKVGFPTLKTEAWKYAGLSFLNNINFELPKGYSISSEMKNKDERMISEANECGRIVLVNGIFSSELSSFDSLPSEISIKQLSEMNEEDKKHFGKYAETSNAPFTAINSAFYNDGAVINIKKNFSAEKPLHLHFLSDSSEIAAWSNPRVLIVAGENCKLDILVSSSTIGENPSLVNSVVELSAGRNSRINIYQIQNDSPKSYYIGSTYVSQMKDSFLNTCTISISGAFIRNYMGTVLTEENCESHFRGFYYCDGKRLVDNHTLVDHAVPNCNSNEQYKGILTDESIGVFNGRILVRRDAQKTNAYQSNKNILLSHDARINTKPELEIYADDVKCSHGATSGSLNEEYMFYLKARGIGHETAKTLLLNAFAGEVISTIAIPELQEYVSAIITEKLNSQNKSL